VPSSDTHYPNSVDVVVIGAGPGGSTTAAKLAQEGRSVLLLERRTHPRFHIGESMLPMMNAVAERLGVFDEIKAQGYVPKHGAEFSRATSGKYGRVPFTAQGPGRHHSTFQVERAHFDKTLAGFARKSGATLLESANVLELLREDGRVTGVRYDHDGHTRTVRAAYVVDAAGRASKVSQTFGLRKYVDRMRMVAVFQHYKGLDEKNNPGETGDIMIGSHEDGWLWAIPIWPDTISVGSVMKREVLRSGEPRELLAEHVGRLERIAQRITGAVPHGDIHVETDYCYYSDTITGPGWFMVGDSGCFFDPIFSGGTYLAMTTGYIAAETINETLAHPERGDELASRYADFYKTGYDQYARIIYAYYEGGYNVRHYLDSINDQLGGGNWYDNKWVVRQFCGDFWSEENLLNQALIRETQWDTFAPFERAWGCPFYGEQNELERAHAAVARLTGPQVHRKARPAWPEEEVTTRGSTVGSYPCRAGGRHGGHSRRRRAARGVRAPTAATRGDRGDHRGNHPRAKRLGPATRQSSGTAVSAHGAAVALRGCRDRDIALHVPRGRRVQHEGGARPARHRARRLAHLHGAAVRMRGRTRALAVSP
jgi:FADH2-dependent halogenase